MRSKGDVSRVFLATVSHGIGFLFVFSGFQRQRFGIFLAAMRSVGDVSDVLLSFSRAFQRRRFESFCGVLLSLSVVRSKGNVSRVFSGYGFAWHRHETSWGSAFSHVLRRLRYGFLSVYCGLFLSLEGSVGNVSRVFCLRFRSVFGPFWARI